MRRVAVAALLVLLWVCPAHAAITASADGPNSTGGQAAFDAFSALALTNGVATGDFIVGTCGLWQTGTGISGVTVTDTVTTSYTAAIGTGLSFLGGVAKPVVFYGLAPKAGANSVTIDPSGTGNYGSCAVKKFAGVHATPLDVAWSETLAGGPTATAADALTTLTANDLVIGVGVADNATTWTADTTPVVFTILGTDPSADNQSYGSEHGLVTTATSYTVEMALGTPVTWAFGTIAFKEAGAVSSTTRCLILGVGQC